MAHSAAGHGERGLRRYCAVSGRAGKAGAPDYRTGNDFGLFLFVVVAYIILSFALDPMPESELYGENAEQRRAVGRRG